LYGDAHEEVSVSLDGGRPPHSTEFFGGKYLVRVLGVDGVPVGSGFQVAPGQIVTAWHLLDLLGRGDPGADVLVGPLYGGETISAVVKRVAPQHDLAVLLTDHPLAISVAGWAASDTLTVNTGVVVQGVAIQDPGLEYELRTAAGSVEGPATRDGIPMLRVVASGVTPGMTGAPVRRQADDFVVGVLSGRYNSSDGWLQHSLWVIRTEHLMPLLDGLAEVPSPSRPDWVLAVGMNNESLARTEADAHDFAQFFAAEGFVPHIASGGTLADVTSAVLGHSDPGPLNRLVVYWSGHATIGSDGDVYLITGTGPVVSADLGNMLRAKTLAQYLARLSARNILVVLDTSFGEPLSEVVSATLLPHSASLVVITSIRGLAEPNLGNALLSVLRNAQTSAGGVSTWIDLGSLLDAEFARRGSEERSRVVVHGSPEVFIPPFAPSAQALLGGYTNDSAYGDDTLGIADEVNMLCSVITAPSVTPPLSIGLFGAWGTGKSFFMQKIMERIAWLRDIDPSNTCSVIQIRFNAWHYMDSNLWASLAVEIFERIVDPEPVGVDDRARWDAAQRAERREERGALLHRLALFQEILAELERGVGKAEAVRREVQEDLKRAENERRDKTTALSKTTARRITAEAAQDKSVVALRSEAAKALGIAIPWSDVTGLAAQLRTVGGQAVAVWRRTSERGLVGVFGLAFVLLTITGLALLGGPGLFRLAGLGPLTGALGVAGVAAARLRPAVEAVRKGLDLLEQSAAKAEELESRLQQEVSAEEVRLASELRAIETEQAAVQTRLAEATAAVERAQREVDDLCEGRRLYEFLAERAADYRRHLGLIGLLRRDFAVLDRQLREYGDDARTLGKLPKVDRIILYIDDLDRCAPERVLEVLQAVHLLLALPLFVVIVGVDPRWLRRSLEHQYRRLIKGRSGGDRMSYWSDLPQQYLEKIFQVPFTLPEMSAGGVARLVYSFLPTAERARLNVGSPVGTEDRMPSVRPAGRPGEDQTLGRAPARRSAITVEEGSAASGSHLVAAGSGLDLTLPELRFVEHLAPLLSSPRAVKRLMNCYRMLRSTRYTGSSSRFLGDAQCIGDYQAVLQLLAVASGFPSLADVVFGALDDQRREFTSWLDVVTSLEPGDVEPTSSSNRLVSVDDPLAEGCFRLHAGLTTLNAATKVLQDIAPYREWAPRVARFSFSL
jgi:hypothetical protein